MENSKVLKMLHDLNNALCASSGFTEMLLTVENREYQKKILGMIQNSYTRAGDIIEYYREQLSIDTIEKEEIT